ncbi:MAG: hypothetical protein JNJ61_26630 [Anaerolineae bacterium]|nr:hypothetical protein [Anaerolineae bacterium]
MTHLSDQELTALETRLRDFDPSVRAAALAEGLSLLKQGAVPTEAEAEVANLHCHTFFSFNAYGHSPTSLAWLARRRGYKLLGTVDFDVLDAVDEFLNACEQLGVRGSTGIEVRVHLPQFATREMNSPGEPGVLYHMGVGFTSSHVPESVRHILADLGARADKRNREMVQRVNAYLDPVKIDFEADVLPLTPKRNPTERHLVVAYVRAAQRQYNDPAAFWADRLNTPLDKITAMLPESPALQNLIRAKLMKKGGVGYMQPDAGSFPDITPLNQLITACGALPCAAWLDGTTTGERDIHELLELLMSQGAVALNIIPDRSWNLANPEEKATKLKLLYEVVELARELGLPLNVGTEMNTYGQKLMDDFDAPELAPVRADFIDGAYFVYGHTALGRAAGLGFQSTWAAAHLPDRRARNAFYTQVGKRLPPGRAAALNLNDQLTPNDILAKLND